MKSLQVGLTGGLASGKSTVGRWLEEGGCTVTDADRLVAELYQPDEDGAVAVAELFGPEVLNRQGGVDHGQLAARVFSDPAARRRLEAAIHPMVRRRYQLLAAQAQGIVVFEVPLLVETGGAGRFDVLVTVEADPEVRLERAVARGMERESARGRLEAQTRSERRIAAADYVLHNDGSLEDLRRQVDELLLNLRSRLAQSS